MSESQQSSGGPGVVADGRGGFHVTNPDLLRILENTASQTRLTIDQVLDKAILNEALIEEQIRFGRRWQLRDERDRTADVDFA